MSIKVMSAVWDQIELDTHEKMVMLALADHANDEGVCYPSIARLSDRTGISDRGIQKIVARLIEKRFLTVEISAGRNGVNVYTVHPTPEPSSPPNHVHPRTAFTTPPNPVPETPEPRSPKPSRTTIEPSEEPPLGPPAVKLPDKSRLPEDWALSDEGWAYARSQQIPDEVIRDEAAGFHAYWSDRRDRDASKSQRGWEQCWATNCRRIASRYRPSRGMARSPAPGGHGRSSSIASIVARRRAEGQV